MSPDKPFVDQHTSNPQSWNLYEYGRNNPLRNVDPNGAKVLQAVVAEAVLKINSLSGGTLYLDFAGIQDPERDAEAMWFRQFCGMQLKQLARGGELNAIFVDHFRRSVWMPVRL